MQRKRNFRVIVDTNCWISFLIGRRLSRLVDLLSNSVRDSSLHRMSNFAGMRLTTICWHWLWRRMPIIWLQATKTYLFCVKSAPVALWMLYLLRSNSDFFICPITQGLFHGSGDSDPLLCISLMSINPFISSNIEGTDPES